MIWPQVLGAILIAAALREIFYDLFHPTASGALSDYVGRMVFRLARARPSTLPLTGPVTLVVTIASWVLGLVLGFALIYWGHFPQDFEFLNGQTQASADGFWGAAYTSLGSLTTVIFNDYGPKSPGLRLLMGLEALLGLTVLTASITWIVLLYPALGRMRTLARRAALVAAAEEATRIPVIAEETGVLLGDFALEVIQTRVEFVHYPIIFYFYADNREASLAHSVAHLERFAESCALPEAPRPVRLAAAGLRKALDDLAVLLAERFVEADPGDPGAVFRAYAAYHERFD